MARSGRLHLTIFLILLTISCHQVFSLKCWMCTSQAEFCDDPFDENNINDAQKRWSYIECTPPPPNQFDRRAVCKKVIQKVNEVSIISRLCYWENMYAPSDECMNQNVPSAITTEFCETCTEDGCNTAITNKPTALLVAIPVAIISKIYLC